MTNTDNLKLAWYENIGVRMNTAELEQEKARNERLARENGAIAILTALSATPYSLYLAKQRGIDAWNTLRTVYAHREKAQYWQWQAHLARQNAPKTGPQSSTHEIALYDSRRQMHHNEALNAHLASGAEQALTLIHLVTAAFPLLFLRFRKNRLAKARELEERLVRAK